MVSDHACTECRGSGVESYEMTDDGEQPIPCDACGGAGYREDCFDCGMPPDGCRCDALYDSWRDER